MFRDLTQPGGNFASFPSPPLCPYIRKRMISLHRFFNFIKTCECVLPPASIPLWLQIKFFRLQNLILLKLVRLKTNLLLPHPYFLPGLYGCKLIFPYYNRILVRFVRSKIYFLIFKPYPDPIYYGYKSIFYYSHRIRTCFTTD